jgi:hypothetical protein
MVSGDQWGKDYEEAPIKYAQLGAHELVIFDPEAALGAGQRGRLSLQVYRREADHSFVRVHAGAGPARSDGIDAWLVVVIDGAVARLRVARDAAGVDLVPTAQEQIAALAAEIERLQQR